MDPWNQMPFIPWNERQSYPRNHPSMEFYDEQYPNNPWPPEYWDQQPSNCFNPWPPEYQYQQPIRRRDSWSQKYYEQEFESMRISSPNRRSFVSYPPLPISYALARQNRIPNYYGWNVPVASRSQSRAPVDSVHKHHMGNSAINYCNLTKVPVNTNTTQPSSNVTGNISGLGRKSAGSEKGKKKSGKKGKKAKKRSGSKRAPLDLVHKHSTGISPKNCSKVAIISVDSDTTRPSSNDAANIPGPGPKKACRQKNTLKAFAKYLKETSPLQNKEMNTNDGLLGKIENNDTTEEDVHYLYSVDPNEGMLVELVDLSKDSQISKNEDLLASESNNTYIPVHSNSSVSDITTVKDSSCDDLINILINNEREKSDAKNIPCGDVYCNACSKSFEELQNNECELYSARCGHLFCVLCIKRLNIKLKCIKCKETITNLRKIVL